MRFAGRVLLYVLRRIKKVKGREREREEKKIRVTSEFARNSPREEAEPTLSLYTHSTHVVFSRSQEWHLDGRRFGYYYDKVPATSLNKIRRNFCAIDRRTRADI